MRTSTSGAAMATASANSAAGSSDGDCPPETRQCKGAYVPQWIGIATRGRSRPTAAAARVGSRWPGPTLAPQPETGIRPTSAPASSLIPSKTSVSPAK